MIRRLGPGDEGAAESACERFSGGGAHLHVGSFLSQPETRLMVAEEDGEVVGWVYGHELAHPDGERTMLLYSLDVVEHARRSGHGRALVEAFVDDARHTGATEVWVLTDDDNAAALATYRSAGGRRDAPLSVMFTWQHAEGREAGPLPGGPSATG